MLVATAGLGLLSRRYPLPGLLAEHTGDALYATAAYFLLAVPFAGARTRTLLGGAFLFAAAVECQQALAWPWLVDLRATRLGALLLGQGFQLADLAAYAAGATLAALADVTFLRPSLPGGPKPDSLPGRSTPPTPGRV
ncbi:MAG: DUF2809 domain-containing protein [Planctomycetes bacterium]|nr:DUF2809 domain-containing protein [Planctomycetota bacterium]